jgi:hypothetical protein
VEVKNPLPSLPGYHGANAHRQPGRAEVQIRKESVFLQQFCFFAVLGFELRASHLFGRRSTTRAVPLALSILVVWGIRFHFMPRCAWTVIFLFVLPQVAGTTGARCCAQPLVETGSHKLVFKTQILLISASQVARTIDASHCTWLTQVFSSQFVILLSY